MSPVSCRNKDNSHVLLLLQDKIGGDAQFPEPKKLIEFSRRREEERLKRDIEDEWSQVQTAEDRQLEVCKTVFVISRGVFNFWGQLNHYNNTQNSNQPSGLVSLKSYRPKAKVTHLGATGRYYVQHLSSSIKHTAKVL